MNPIRAIDWWNVVHWLAWTLAIIALIGVGVAFIWPFLKLMGELFLPI